MVEVATPLATIAVPTFNRAELLQRAVASARAQDYPAVEILIVDNASKDDTRSVCRWLMMQEARIRYICQPSNVGPARNFDTALQNARGHYFMWLADDDWISPNYVRRCIEELERGDHVVVVGREYWHFGQETIQQPVQQLLDLNPQKRIMSYLFDPRNSAPIYGISRTLDRRLQPSFPGQIGGDVQWIVRALWRGTIAVAQDASLHRYPGGASSDFSVLAASLGHGSVAQALPRNAMALGLTLGMIREGGLSNRSAPRVHEWAMAFWFGFALWVGLGCIGEFSNPLRRKMQENIPDFIYRRMTQAYKPIRRVQRAMRDQILGAPNNSCLFFSDGPSSCARIAKQERATLSASDRGKA